MPNKSVAKRSSKKSSTVNSKIKRRSSTVNSKIKRRSSIRNSKIKKNMKGGTNEQIKEFLAEYEIRNKKKK